MYLLWYGVLWAFQIIGSIFIFHGFSLITLLISLYVVFFLVIYLYLGYNRPLIQLAKKFDYIIPAVVFSLMFLVWLNSNQLVHHPFWVIFLFYTVSITLLHFYQKVVSYFFLSILCISLCFYFYV